MYTLINYRHIEPTMCVHVIAMLNIFVVTSIIVFCTVYFVKFLLLKINKINITALHILLLC